MKIKWRILSCILAVTMMIYPVSAYAEEVPVTAVAADEIQEETTAEETITEETADESEFETEYETRESWLETETTTVETVKETETEAVLESEIVEEPDFYAPSPGCIETPVSGTRHYDYAYRALELMNELRADYGYEPLVMDESLLEKQMVRSAEMTLRFSLNRPNDTYGYCSVWLRHGSCGWLKENYGWIYESYHPLNILDPNVKSVGIGCFENNGMYYWTDYFSEGKGTSVVKSGSEFVDENIDIKAERLKYASAEEERLSLAPGETLNLSVYQYYAEDGTIPEYKSLMRPGLLQWSSSNSKVATVDQSGGLKAVSKGTAVISAKYNNAVVYQWNVSVNEKIQVVNPQIVYSGSKVYQGMEPCTDEYKKWFTITYNGTTLTDDDYHIVSYTTGPNAVFVSFELEFCGNYSGTYEYVLPIAVNGIRLNSSFLELQGKGAGGQLVATVLPENAANKKVNWSSSNTNVVTVSSNGVFVAAGEGTATIMARTEDGGYIAECDIKVVDPGADYEKIKTFVERLYNEILGRSADPAGLSAWTDVLYSGKEQGAKVAQGFIGSDELKKRNLSDEAYIRALYRTFFNRDADSGGLAAWKKVLDSGLSRMHVFKGFAESDEFTKICDSYGIIRGYAELTAPMDQNEGVTKFIVRSYRLCLNREADASGLNGWCDAILSGRNTAKEAAHGFVFSNEFIKKDLSDREYVKVLYRVFMDREADGGGLSSWEKVLKEGKSREHVFNGFADSAEFRKICQSYGIK